LGDVVANVNDYFDRTTTDVYRYIAGDHIDEGSLTVRRWGETEDDTFPPTFNRRFRSGDVLFHSRNLRKLVRPTFAGVTGEKLFVLRVTRPDLLLPELLPFLLQTRRFKEYVNRMWAGSTNKFLNKTPLMRYEFALPPIAEQWRLVSVLEAARELEETIREALDHLVSVRESWLEHEFAMLERDWPVSFASDLMRRITVGIVVRPADLYVPKGRGVAALRSLNVLPDKIVMDDVVHISPKGHAEHRKSRLEAGDVVIVRSGRPGDAAVVPEDAVEMNCIDLIICSVGPQLLPHFVCATVNSRFGRQQFAAGIAGTAQQHFNVGAFKNFRIPLPPMSVQAAFVARLQGSMQMLARTEQRLASVRVLRSDLLKAVLET
jgi:type I restriction enzyme S subunit